MEEHKPSVCEVKPSELFSEGVLKELKSKMKKTKGKVAQECRLLKIDLFFLYCFSKETRALFSFPSTLTPETSKVMERSKKTDSVDSLVLCQDSKFKPELKRGTDFLKYSSRL